MEWLYCPATQPPRVNHYRGIITRASSLVRVPHDVSNTSIFAWNPTTSLYLIPLWDLSRRANANGYRTHTPPCVFISPVTHSFLKFSLKILLYCLCVRELVFTCQNTQVEVREEHVGVGSLLPSHGSSELSSLALMIGTLTLQAFSLAPIPHILRYTLATLHWELFLIVKKHSPSQIWVLILGWWF